MSIPREVRNFRSMFSNVFPNLFILRGVIYLEEISNQIHYHTRRAEFSKFIIASSLEMSRFKKKEEKKADIFHETSCHLRANNKRYGWSFFSFLFFFLFFSRRERYFQKFFMHYRWLDDRLSFQRARLCFKSFC